MAWPDSGTNEVTESIGATGRDYETISAWEAATDEDCTSGWGAGIYADPCSPVGDMYDDADLNGNGVGLSGATSDSTHYRRLTVHAGERHDGTVWGSGVTVLIPTTYDMYVYLELYCVLEWFIASGAGTIGVAYYTPSNARTMWRNVAADITGSEAFGPTHKGSGSEIYVRNCVVSGPSSYAYKFIDYLQNCSCIGGSYSANGCGCTNVISVDASISCYYSCTGDYNIGSDTSAPGDNSIDNVDGVDIFADVNAGQEDLHLLSDATAASGVGSDLSGSFTDDIDGDTRSDWDIGADEYVTVGGVAPTSHIYGPLVGPLGGAI